jgi:hypothetical protein
MHKPLGKGERMMKYCSKVEKQKRKMCKKKGEITVYLPLVEIP